MHSVVSTSPRAVVVDSTSSFMVYLLNQIVPVLQGNSFVTQYYSVLRDQSGIMYRFFTNDSTFTHAEATVVDGVEAPVETVTGQMVRTSLHVQQLHVSYAFASPQLPHACRFT